MTEHFSIRPAAPVDIPVIFNLIQQLAEYEKLSAMVSGTEAMLANALFGASRAAECIVAREHDIPIGFALYFTTFSTFLCRPGLYLEDLFVIPTARGKGYGKALLTYLAKLALDRDCGRMEWRVLDWNEPSIRFYRSLGACIMPEWQLVRMTAAEMAALI